MGRGRFIIYPFYVNTKFKPEWFTEHESDLLKFYGTPLNSKHDYDFCRQVISTKPNSLVLRRLYIKTIIVEPMSVVKNLGHVFGLVKRDLLFLFNADIFDEMGIRDFKEIPARVGVTLQLVFQSKNLVFSSDWQRGFGYLPMKRLHLVTKDMQSIISKIGGFWSSLKSISFFLTSYLLYRKFIKQEAAVIQKMVVRG